MNKENINLAQRTAETLRKEIYKKQTYRDGEKLPNENELSSSLGVSRTTLREAIRILVSEGVLKVQRGKGTFVTEQMEHLADSGLNLDQFPDMKVTLHDLYETRMIFEPESAALACKRATDAEIEHILKLGQICQNELKKNPKSKKRIESECAFHGAILKASHNDFLSRFMPMLTETIEKTIAMDFNLEMIAEDAYKDHILIMHFLEKRDSQALKSAVMIHLHHAFLNEGFSLPS